MRDPMRESMHEPMDPSTRTCLVMLTVPAPWRGLDVAGVKIKLASNLPALLDVLAREVHRTLQGEDLDAADLVARVRALQEAGGGVAGGP